MKKRFFFHLFFHRSNLRFSAEDIFLRPRATRRMRGGTADMAHQSTGLQTRFTERSNARFCSNLVPRDEKNAVCQVFISPGRPGKTHFRAAMRRSSDLGEPLRTVAAPRGAVPGCSTWVQGYLGAHLGAAPECRGTWVQYQGAVPGCSTWGGAPRKGWVAPAPGCSTWVQYLGAAPRCSTWVQYLGAGVPGWSTWVQYLGAVPGCCTWVQYLGAAQHLGAVPGVAHPVRGGWPPHPVRGAAPRQGFHLWWPTCVKPLQSSSGRRTP